MYSAGGDLSRFNTFTILHLSGGTLPRRGRPHGNPCTVAWGAFNLPNLPGTLLVDGTAPSTMSMAAIGDADYGLSPMASWVSTRARPPSCAAHNSGASISGLVAPWANTKTAARAILSEKIAPRPWRSRGANTYTETTTSTAAIATRCAGGATGRLSSGQNTLTDNSVLPFNRIYNGLVVTKKIVPSSGLIAQIGPPNKYVLYTVNKSFTGGDTISAGTLQLAVFKRPWFVLGQRSRKRWRVGHHRQFAAGRP